MRTRIFNAKILTMESNKDIFDGELWIDGNTISYIGEKKDITHTFDLEIDAEQNVLMPGFKNAHTHSAMTFLRSYADDLPLLEWLNKQVFPMEAKLKEEHVYAFSRIAIMEYLTSGITCNFDMYLYPEAIAQASVDCGFRTVLCGGINDYVSSCEEMEEQYNKLNNFHELISFRLGLHAEYTTSDGLIEKISALAKKEKAPVYTHISESSEEVRQCIERTGKTPTERLESKGIFDFGGGAFHCVHLTDGDIDIFKKRGIYVITNPGSNCKLASGIAPLTKMLEQGLKIGIGTDGPASNNCLDMFREMFLLTGLQKISNRDASAMDAYTVLGMAVKYGAEAIGLHKCTELKEGNLADLIIIDLNQPNMQPINNITKNIVYSGSKQNVKLTMVNGKVLYKNGEFFIGCEPKEVYAKANEMIRMFK